jgi:hypothetical protein
MRPQDLLKAIRALSARYVERRADLRDRSPIDSRGKRAAFAAFFAPLHFVITREIVRALDLVSPDAESILDLGCGTGVAGAAWAVAGPRVSNPRSTSGLRPEVAGIDRDRWALAEALWTWRQLGVRGRTRPGDVVREAARLAGRLRGAAAARHSVIAAWSVNELAPTPRARLLDSLLELARLGAPVLVIEPIARRVSPWWPEWVAGFTNAGGRADEWRFDTPLPPRLGQLSDGAGFRRDALTARSLAIRNRV